MSILELIKKRRSAARFTDKPVEDGIIDKLVDYISELEPPVSDIDWNFDTLPYIDMIKIARSEPGIKAPYYLVLRAERKNFSLQNSGYIGELAVLYLTGLGLATRWQGSIAVPRLHDFPDTLPYVTAIAFGYSDDPFRSPSEQPDRLPLKKLAFGFSEPFEEIIEAARLAPSSYNRQPCAYVADDTGRLHVYRRKSLLQNPMTQYLNCIDSGIALAHLYASTDELGMGPEIVRLKPEPKFKNMIYQASLKFNKH